MVLDWYSVTINALLNLWQGLLGALPIVLGAIIVFVIGWFVSVGIGKLFTEILKKAKFNQLFDKGAWKTAFDKAEIKVDASNFVGAIVKWVFVIVFLLAAVDILGLREFAGFLRSVLAYLPNVIVAVLIFVVTVIVVDIVEKLVRVTVESVKIGYGAMVSAVIKWSIWFFAILTILYQLGVARPFMETLFTGLVAMLVIALGLSFGLGGKDVAADILQNLKRKLKE